MSPPDLQVVDSPAAGSPEAPLSPPVIRSRAVALQRVFAPVRALLAESGMLALNASVACGRLGGLGRSFATVAGDLHASGATLARRIEEIEVVFERVAVEVGRWSRTERRIRALQAAIDALRGAQGARPLGPWGPMWLPEVGREWRILGLEAPVNATEARLWAVLNAARDELIEAIADLQQQLTGLERHVDRIRWAAVRQTRYLRILASIEQAHLHGQGGAVEAVIHAMRRLDDRISALEEEARDRVEKVQGLMNSFCRMIWPPRAVLEAV
jgi:hypothetical protein